MEGLRISTQNIGEDSWFSGLVSYPELVRILLSMSVMYVTKAFVAREQQGLCRGRVEGTIPAFILTGRRKLQILIFPAVENLH